MSKIIDYKPQSQLKSAAQLDSFIEWAKSTLEKGVNNKLVHAGIQWDMDSWHKFGIKHCSFTAHRPPRYAQLKHDKYMQSPFLDFVKALVVYYKIYRGGKSVSVWLTAARKLEVALIELTGERDVTKVSASICNRACEYLITSYPDGNQAYRKSKGLEQIVRLMKAKGLLVKPIRWTSPLRLKDSGTLVEQKINREKKLPSRESIQALGEIFNNDLTNPLDIVTVSACTLLLSQPSRVGELADIERDFVVFKENAADGSKRMFMRWFSEKGFGATIKPVITGMESSVDRVVKLLLPITEEARTYAAWLEDHPDEFPPHEDVPLKGPDDPLSYDEACAALKLQVNHPTTPRNIFKMKFLDSVEKNKALSPQALRLMDEFRTGWDTSKGKRVYVNGKLSHFEFCDRANITLRKLNVLLRAKYLSRDFPYTTPVEDGKKRVKYRDALFTVRTGSLPRVEKNKSSMLHNFGVEIAAHPCRISLQLGSSKEAQSIFERHGYMGVKVKTHTFRHELNTEMHRAGLSQLLIDAFSGRTTMGSVYNHETVEERTQRVAQYHPKTKSSNAIQRLEKIKTNQPLSLSDVRDLHESDQNLVIHQTHVGICTHNFASEPCPKMGACLTCGKLGCVKGDDVKLANLKEERADLKRRYEKALVAKSRDTFGASEWVKRVGLDLYKCNALIRTLENPELENGDIVWNVDNGWTLTNNAAAMTGLMDANVIEAKNEPLPSLDELSAMLDDIEV